MRKIYLLSANAVSWLHVVWILVLLAGVPVLMWNPGYGPVELGLIALTFLAQKLWKGCPLTLLEEGWREKHDPTYRRRTAFIEPLLRRLGIRRRLHLTPVHLGIFTLGVLLVSSIVR